MFWDNIMIQYTAIIRAHRIMNIVEQDDLTKELKRIKTKSDSVGSKDNKQIIETYKEEYLLKFAWEIIDQ